MSRFDSFPMMIYIAGGYWRVGCPALQSPVVQRWISNGTWTRLPPPEPYAKRVRACMISYGSFAAVTGHNARSSGQASGVAPVVHATAIASFSRTPGQ